jgi:hypothetical protein
MPSASPGVRRQGRIGGIRAAGLLVVSEMQPALQELATLRGVVHTVILPRAGRVVACAGRTCRRARARSDSVAGLAIVGWRAHSLGELAEGTDYLADARAVIVSLLAIRVAARHTKAPTVAALVNAG